MIFYAISMFLMDVGGFRWGKGRNMKMKDFMGDEGVKMRLVLEVQRRGIKPYQRGF